MPSDALALSDAPPRPPASEVVRVPATAKGKEIRGKLKTALDLIVYGDEDGGRYDHLSAARKVGFTTQAIRKALERPHVLRYLREQKQVFRAHASAGNVTRAVQLREQDENKTAAIQAIRYLDGLSEQDAAREVGRNVQPGVVVNVSINAEGRTVDETVIEVGPGASTARPSADDEPERER